MNQIQPYDPVQLGAIFAQSGMFPDTRNAAQCATKLAVGQAWASPVRRHGWPSRYQWQGRLGCEPHGRCDQAVGQVRLSC